MANVSTPPTSNASTSSPLSSPELNFEDLITVSNVLSEPESDQEIILKNSTEEMLPADFIEDESQTISRATAKTTTTLASSSPSTVSNSSESLLQQKIVSLTKIVPKQTATTTTAKISAAVKGSNSGQVVIIQGPSGPVPIRIAGSTAAAVTKTVTGGQITTTASSSTTNAKTTVRSPKDSPTGNKPVTIQVLKMADGSLVPIKKNKTLNLTNLSNISQLPVIVKTTNGPKSVIGAQTKLTSGAPILKSLTLAEAQKAGFIKPKPNSDSLGLTRLQKILPASSTTTSATTPGSTSSSTSSTIKTASVAAKEITIKSETDGTTKQIVVPQHMVKLHSSAGPIQAIQIPGKPGVQYVRVLSSSSSGSGAKVVTAVKKDASPTKTPFTGGHQRIVMSSSGKSSFSIANSTKETGMTTTKGNTLISTVPTLRKIQDATATTKLVTSSSNDSERPTSQHPKQLLQIKKINPASMINNNSESKLFTLNTASKNFNRNSLPSTTTHQVIRKIEPRSILTPTINDPPPAVKPKMAYTSMDTPQEFTKEELSLMFARRSPSPEALRRKHCNCTKSQCLKLYCDCFANGEFCQDCNCKECYNNLEYEDERQKAIKICLERNPNAFKPKITKAKDQSDLRLHNKGCNCKRSGCLKNYCECYEAKIACSSNCKCFGCRNVEDRSDRDMFEDSQPQPNITTERVRPPKRAHEETLERPMPSSTSTALRLQDGQLANKQPYNFITQDVVDATIQCMIAQADECTKSRMSDKDAERMIIEELGRCLVEIIDFSIRNMDN